MGDIIYRVDFIGKKGKTSTVWKDFGLDKDKKRAEAISIKGKVGKYTKQIRL